MAEDDSRLIRLLYAGALQRDPEERDEYLEGACADRPDLRTRVAALLQAHSQDFLDAPTALPGESASWWKYLAPTEFASSKGGGSGSSGSTPGAFVLVDFPALHHEHDAADCGDVF